MSPANELHALALTLAYDFACSVIESNCVPVSDQAEEPGWFELPVEPLAEIDDCVRFLEMRGLLERHATRPDWVRVADESEAER